MPARVQFAGFPDGPLQATTLPSLFFRDLLGPIDDLGELKLALYVFWRVGQKKRYPRFLTRQEIDHDAAIASGFATLANGSLDRALTRLEDRGVVLRRSMELSGTREECIFLNTASGRRAIADLESGRIELGQVVYPVDEATREDRPGIFQLYEQNVGLLTPLIVEELSEAERLFPGDWIEEAFRQAVAYNKRNWKYVRRILERWSTDGKSSEAPGRGSPRPGAASSQSGRRG